MPPGPAYNFLCVLSSAANILTHAARIRAAQSGVAVTSTRKRRKLEVDAEQIAENDRILSSTHVDPETKETSIQKDAHLRSANYSAYPASTSVQPVTKRELPSWLTDEPEVQVHTYPAAPERKLPQPDPPDKLQDYPSVTFDTSLLHKSELDVIEPQEIAEPKTTPTKPHQISDILFDTTHLNKSELDVIEVQEASSAPISRDPFAIIERVPEPEVTSPLPDIPSALPVFDPPTARNLQSSKVPSSRIGRFFHYGGLAASLGYGAASEVLRRSTSSSEHGGGQSSVMMTEANIKRLVSKLSQMRGAALKLGQFMSIQDTHLLPPEIDKIFRRVQDSAHYMPDWQLEKVLATALGPSYASNFTSFDRVPFAAASIGQVHHAVLSASSSPTGKEENVAVKIQFPNIAESIGSDLGYVKMLLSVGGLLPKGLFLDRTIQVMKGELADECDYKREASYLTKFGSSELLGNDPRYKVPWVWEGSTDTVLVMEHVGGVSVGEANIGKLSQEERDEIATRVIELCLKELFQFRTMQTDPNWTNFLWNAKTQQIELVDFGATREYSKEFMDNWLHLLQAGAAGDRDACVEWSLKLGYLTGEENEIMLDAHIKSMTLLAAPFRSSTPQPVAFGPGTAWADATNEIRELIPVMLQHRLTPPPKETYSLNRKLSGAFLLASRLGAKVDTKQLWDGVIENYRFGP